MYLVGPFVPRLICVRPRTLRCPLKERLGRGFRGVGLRVERAASRGRIEGVPNSGRLRGCHGTGSALIMNVEQALGFSASGPSTRCTVPLTANYVNRYRCYCLRAALKDGPCVHACMGLRRVFRRTSGCVRREGPRLAQFRTTYASSVMKVSRLARSLGGAVRFVNRARCNRLHFIAGCRRISRLLSTGRGKGAQFQFDIGSQFMVGGFRPNASSFSSQLRTTHGMTGTNCPLNFVMTPVCVRSS